MPLLRPVSGGGYSRYPSIIQVCDFTSAIQIIICYKIPDAGAADINTVIGIRPRPADIPLNVVIVRIRD